MNQGQRKNILDAIEAFRIALGEGVFEKKFSEAYKDLENADELSFLDYSVGQIFAFSKQGIDLLQEQIENGNWQVLPTSQPLTGFGTIIVVDTIKNLTTYLK